MSKETITAKNDTFSCGIISSSMNFEYRPPKYETIVSVAGLRIQSFSKFKNKFHRFMLKLVFGIEIEDIGDKE